MALHVALNRTPKGTVQPQVDYCEGNKDFTLEDMQRIQEKIENSQCDLQEIKCKINQILYESASVAGLRTVRLIFCKDEFISDSDNVRTLVAKNINKNNLEELAGWLRNNGYNTAISWNAQPYGNMLGSIFIWW